MQYQVVARSRLPSTGGWDYFPYLAPCRDKLSAERLARYAARSGYEAAILQSVTMEMLTHIACAVVERQDEFLLPKLRYMPGAVEAQTDTHEHYKGDSELHFLAHVDPYAEGPDKAVLDARRWAMEQGHGGDVLGVQRGSLTFPLRMDVLGAWLRLRERVIMGQFGGDADGRGDAVTRDAETDSDVDN